MPKTGPRPSLICYYPSHVIRVKSDGGGQHEEILLFGLCDVFSGSHVLVMHRGKGRNGSESAECG